VRTVIKAVPRHPQARPIDGITRRVLGHGKRTLQSNGRYAYRYDLECGHVVIRWAAGKQFCYCAACLMVRG
jgi:hypothetical protein